MNNARRSGVRTIRAIHEANGIRFLDIPASDTHHFLAGSSHRIARSNARSRCNSIISHKPSATADENNNNDVRHDQHHQLHQPHRQIDPCSTKPPTPTAPPLLLRSNGARLDTGALPGLPEDGGGGYRRGDSVMPYGLSSDAPPESYGAVEGEYQRQQQDHFTTSGLRPSKSVSDLTSLQYYEINGAAKIVGGGEGDSEQRNEGDSRSGMGGTIGKQGGFTCRYVGLRRKRWHRTITDSPFMFEACNAIRFCRTALRLTWIIRNQLNTWTKCVPSTDRPMKYRTLLYKKQY